MSDEKKVVPLRADMVNCASVGEPDLDIVEMLEEALQRAKTGEIRSVALAHTGPGSGYKIRYICADEVGFTQIIALISRLWHEALSDDFKSRNTL